MAVVYTGFYPYCSLDPIHQLVQQTIVHTSSWLELAFDFKAGFHAIQNRNQLIYDVRFNPVKHFVI